MAKPLPAALRHILGAVRIRADGYDYIMDNIGRRLLHEDCVIFAIFVTGSVSNIGSGIM